MPAPMARQEDDLGLAEATEAQRIGRLAPGRCDALFANVGEAREVVHTRAADDAEDGAGHVAAVFALRLATRSFSLGGVRTCGS